MKNRATAAWKPVPTQLPRQIVEANANTTAPAPAPATERLITAAVDQVDAPVVKDALMTEPDFAYIPPWNPIIPWYRMTPVVNGDTLNVCPAIRFKDTAVAPAIGTAMIFTVVVAKYCNRSLTTP